MTRRVSPRHATDLEPQTLLGPAQEFAVPCQTSDAPTLLARDISGEVIAVGLSDRNTESGRGDEDDPNE